MAARAGNVKCKFLFAQYLFFDRGRGGLELVGLHRIRGATLGERADRGGVAEHLRQRHAGVDEGPGALPMWPIGGAPDVLESLK